jgi:hypothetical protein
VCFGELHHLPLHPLHVCGDLVWYIHPSWGRIHRCHPSCPTTTCPTHSCHMICLLHNKLHSHTTTSVPCFVLSLNNFKCHEFSKKKLCKRTLTDAVLLHPTEAQHAGVYQIYVYAMIFTVENCERKLLRTWQSWSPNACKFFINVATNCRNPNPNLDSL